jgi:competence protein ComEC
MMSRAIEAISKWWRAEATRHFLWLPAGFAGGIALYYGLPNEPSNPLLTIGAGVAFVLMLILWRHARAVGIALFVIAAGAAWANFSAHQSEHIQLAEALEPRPMMGTVSYIERTEHGVRLTLKDVWIKDVFEEKVPTLVRLTVRLKSDSTLELPHIGESIWIMAGLRPPMGPALPYGFDFARYFYFRDIGAVGYGLPPWFVRGEQPTTTLADTFWDWRIRITEDIIKTTGKATGGVAAGLITGDGRAISEADFEALRASNLYHIIAISGEHMVVIAGVIFVSLRLLALLILPRRLAFRPQVKTFAAALSLILVTAYLFVTGLPISAVRAYFMIFLVLMAVIFRRQVDAMRSLAIAALVMLVIDPSDLLEPGFQLSFAATMAIIALVEITILRPTDRIENGRFRRGLRLIFAMLMISVVAEAATGPLVVAMFNNVSLYGIPANMLATSLVSLYLMPTVALYFILLPFGWQHGALWLMNWGIKGLLGIAHWIASFPHAQMFSPSIPGYGVVLFVFGLMWICLWQTRVRRYGIIAMVLGIATVMLNHSPDMLVGSELKQLAFRSGDNYVLARGRKGSMIPSIWANGLGYKELPKAGKDVWQCEGPRNKNCTAQFMGITAAFPADAEHFASACHNTDIIFTTDEYPVCENGAQVVDKVMLQGSNVLALWVDKNKKIRIEKSSDWQGDRPWSAIAAEDDLAE